MIHKCAVWQTLRGLALLAILLCCFSSAKAEASAETQPKRGGRLVVALNNVPAHFNPAVHSGTLTTLVGTQIFAGLLRCDRNGEPRPYLAQSWEYSPDNLTLTMHLAPDAFFHDGVAVTAKDVIFSIQVVRDLHPFSPMLAAVTSLEAADKHTVIVRLRHRHPALLKVFTAALTPILPEHIYGDGQNLRTHPANWQPVGSGPFRLAAYEPGQSIVLKRFDRFFLKDRPYLDAIQFNFFPGPDEIPLAMETGKVHLTGFSPLADHHEQYAQNKHLEVSTEGLDGIGAMLWLGMNLRKAPFQDHRVRQALALAIDQEFITHRILRGSSKIMDGPLTPGSPFYVPLQEDPGVHIDTANRLLDEAGYKRDPNGKRMTILVDYLPNAANLAIPLIQYLRHYFSRTLGIDLTIRKNSNFAEWAAHVASGEFQMNLDIVFTWGDPLIGVHRIYHSSNVRPEVLWSNTQGYANPEVDRILDQAGQEADPALRKVLYDDFQRLVRNDQPILWLGTTPYATIYDRRLRGLNESYWGLLAPMDGVFWTEEQP